MIKYKYIFFILIFFPSCRHVEKYYSVDGNLESEVSYKCGKFDGTAIWYYPDGRKKMTVNYQKGLKEGEMKRFFRNGNIETIDNYKNDSLNGISLKYEENGVLISEISYKNGKKNGIIKQYFSDGSPFITGKYANDQYDGKWEYFDMEGFLVGEGNFKNGTGVLMGYDNNGNITRKVHYKNSLINKEEIYSKENNQIEKTIIYENGRIVRTVTD